MLPRHYFTRGTLIGLICALAAAIAIIGPAALDLILPFGGKSASFAVLGGAIAAYALAEYFDSRVPGPGRCFFRTALAYPVLIFLAGIAAGSLLNLLISASLLNSPFGLLDEIQSWLLKPFAVIGLVGTPLALLLGSIYFMAYGRRARNPS